MKLTPLLPKFEFASFSFPKYLFTLPPGPLRARLESSRNRVTGDYYHAPKPLERGAGVGFYLGEARAMGMVWQWCDDVAHTRIHHTGWFFEADCFEKIRGLVAALPNRRGFLAGWSMGVDMSSELDYEIHDCAEDAAHAADAMAEAASDRQREHELAEAAE